MNRSLPLIALAIVLALPSAASAATPQQTIKQLRAQLATSKSLVAKQKKQITSLTAQRDGFDAQLQTTKASLATTQAALGGVTADRDAQAAGLSTATATIGALQVQIGGLQAQVAAQAQGGAAAVIAGGPNAMWAAIVAIWQAFPMLPPSGFCGYDKSNSITGGTGLNFARYDFENITNC
jgi:hypothetical protein